MGILSAFRFAFQNAFFTPVLYGVIASLAIFSASWEKGDRLKDQLTDAFRSQQDTFDFIIVGGGSSGAVLAYRLSKYHTVLLLEAGGESHPFQAIPALSLFIPNYPATDWSHKSVTQTSSCLACVDKRYTFSQGKNLGGSGNLNYLIHLRGHYKDYDNWARITGDSKWSYDQVLKDFTISENFVGTTTDTTAHGYGGPLQIEMPTEIGLANEWNLAGQEMGYPHIDLNGKYEEGFDALYYPIKHGIRQATYRAFIQPIRHRGSLLIIRKFAHVNKILIREETKFAYAVNYDRHGHSVHAFANKEIIISAGTLQTPKILELSGIGPRSILEGCGIPVKSDLPVGRSLQDHISTLIGPFFINSPKTFSYDDVSPKSFFQFMQYGKGPLTTSGFQATALMTSTLAKTRGQSGWPDIQLTLLGISPHRLFSSDLSHAFGLKEDIIQRFFLHAKGKSAFFIVVSVARPESRGEVHIQSSDPYKPLRIDPNYFSDPEGKDMKVMLEGIHRALYLAENTTVFRNCDVKLAEKCFPGCENHIYRSLGYWECYVRHLTITLNDQVGTAQMGYKSSPYAVVDSDLKVMGINSLRVVDASIMPTIIGTNTQAATIMIAEKASSLILQEWADTAINYDNHKPGSGYGPPPVSSQQPVKTSSNNSPNSVVVDDLTPPGLPGPDQAYNNYDSFDLLRNKGLESVQSINLNGGTTTPIVLNHPSSSTSIPLPNQQDDEYEIKTTISEDIFTTPGLYQEVYDPTTPSSLREGKAYEFDNNNNILQQQDDYDVGVASTTTIPASTTESYLTQGPNGSSLILRKRKKLPRIPNVTVHPRGHLGYDFVDTNDPSRVPKLKSTLPPPLISTSIEPLPTNVVVIKKRRPRIRRKRPKSSASNENILEEPSFINTTPITESVSPRLRNFIPPVRGKRGNTVFRGEDAEKKESTEEKENVSTSSQYFKSRSSEERDDDDDEDNKENSAREQDDNVVENELKMVVLDGTDHPIMPMDMDPLPEIIASSSTSSKSISKSNSINSQTNTNNNANNQSSLTKTILGFNRLSFTAAEQRKTKMAKFVRSSSSSSSSDNKNVNR